MDPSAEFEKLKILPKAVKINEAIPPTCSVAQRYPNIIIRNDGFNAGAVYTLDNFYAHMANILGNMERMIVDGAILQVKQHTSGNNSINILLLYDKRVLLGTRASIYNSGKIQSTKVPGTPPGTLHTNPSRWSFEGALQDGTKVSFHPVYDIPLNYVVDAKNASGSEGRDIDAPSIIVGYGKGGVIDYALNHYSNPPKPKQINPLPNPTIADAIVLVTKEVTSKIARIKGLK